ncbi:MAG: hypothetical protein EPN82_05815 [Bacteroidetes bacterium]|nr:MAG: hypothetical protein EPN82_05815 [Bacteroidota bacterium]
MIMRINRKHVVPDLSYDSKISHTLAYTKQMFGDTMIPVFRNGDYSFVPLDDLSDWENNVFHNTMQKFIIPPLPLYEICRRCYNLMLSTPASGIIPERLKPLEYFVYDEGKKIQIERILFDNRARFDKYIHKEKINGKIDLYLEKVPSPKPSRMIFKYKKSYVRPLWNTDSELPEAKMVDKMIDESRKIIIMH